MHNYVIINGELYHHGIKGMKWGRRRFQNKDGSLTPAGKRRLKESSANSENNKNVKAGIAIAGSIAATTVGMLTPFIIQRGVNHVAKKIAYKTVLK